MRLSTVIALALALGGAASAGRPPSRAEQMKACANEWRAKKHMRQTEGLKYQRFIGDCLKATAASNVHA